MLILKAYKFRLEPTEQQAQRLRPCCGWACFIWNVRLAETKRLLDLGQKLPSAFELNRKLIHWKKAPETAFLSKAYTNNLQQKFKDLHDAWMRYFDKTLSTRVPVFKKKSDNRNSIEFVNFEKYCQLEHRHVKIPASLSWVKCPQSQPIDGKIKNAMLSQSSSHWLYIFSS
ncbi:helix-turn-helix domain-containing protein [Photorhabdus heterorhabditis]|uniref:helix-turn-helix domain-containing protein n=1 Tax=Photorhabdus heterorhabditis TaxID=880156 RepID=UPI00156220F3|nr:helix-turn-helix domain-containing protein [Photorhabdus heterorhabditis]NRN28954.1 helix-turn-helix domain-containing protein [Photorhabdus heterorhabditis subsp. aluminescens]